MKFDDILDIIFGVVIGLVCCFFGFYWGFNEGYQDHKEWLDTALVRELNNDDEDFNWTYRYEINGEEIEFSLNIED